MAEGGESMIEMIKQNQFNADFSRGCYWSWAVLRRWILMYTSWVRYSEEVVYRTETIPIGWNQKIDPVSVSYSDLVIETSPTDDFVITYRKVNPYNII